MRKIMKARQTGHSARSHVQLGSWPSMRRPLSRSRVLAWAAPRAMTDPALSRRPTRTRQSLQGRRRTTLNKVCHSEPAVSVRNCTRTLNIVHGKPVAALKGKLRPGLDPGEESAFPNELKQILRPTDALWSFAFRAGTSNILRKGVSHEYTRSLARTNRQT